MNKNDLIESVAAQLDISKASANKAVSTVLGAILKGLSSDGQVAIPGFGTFASKQKLARVPFHFRCRWFGASPLASFFFITFLRKLP